MLCGVCERPLFGSRLKGMSQAEGSFCITIAWTWIGVCPSLVLYPPRPSIGVSNCADVGLNRVWLEGLVTDKSLHTARSLLRGQGKPKKYMEPKLCRGQIRL